MPTARNNIVATLYDGRTIAYGMATFLVNVAGNYAITVTIARHRDTERVLEYKLTTNPITDPGTPTSEVITANVVGCTLMGVGAGTTITVEVTASGF